MAGTGGIADTAATTPPPAAGDGPRQTAGGEIEGEGLPSLPEPARKSLLGWARMHMAAHPRQTFGREKPFMYRWHVTGEAAKPECQPFEIYLHEFVGDDPMPLHDHAWASLSVMLEGRVVEEYLPAPGGENDLPQRRQRILRRGEIVYRPAEWAHRILVPYGPAITVFVVGPWVRDFGRWYPEGWRSSGYKRALCP